MNDLLTDEEREKYEAAKHYCLRYSTRTYPQGFDFSGVAHELYCHLGKVMSVIDTVSIRLENGSSETVPRAAASKV